MSPRSPTSGPSTSRRKSATASASSPTTMFAGMIAPEKPPLRMANSTSSVATLRVSKFGPLVRSPPETWPSGFEPCAGRGRERVAAAAALVEQLRALLVGGRVDLDLLRLAAGEERARDQGGGKRSAGSSGGHTIRRPVRRLLPLTMLLAVLAAGCGGDDDEPGRTVTTQSGEDARRGGRRVLVRPRDDRPDGRRRADRRARQPGLARPQPPRASTARRDIGGTPTFSGGRPAAGHASAGARRVRARLHGRRPRRARDDGHAAGRSRGTGALARRIPRPPRWRWWRP